MKPSYIPKTMKFLRLGLKLGFCLLPFLLFGFLETKHNIEPAFKSGSDPDATFLREAVSAHRPELANRLRLTTLTHTIGRGETLSSIWKRFGSDAGMALKAEEALKQMGNGLHLLKTGEELKLRLEEDGTIRSIKRALADGSNLILRLTRRGDYTTSLREPEVVTQEKTVSAVVSSSIANSAAELGISFALVDQLVDLFGSKVEFSRDLQPGDSFALNYRVKTLKNGKVVEEPELINAALWLSGEMLVAVSDMDQNGKRQYYDQNGDALGNYFLRYPLKFSRISSSFSQSRFHPVLKKRRPHNGVDFAAPIGTEVRAVADGTIMHASYDRASGNMIKIRHDQRYSTAYLHLSRIAGGIRPGMRIARGQVLGAVGMSGLATGPHLHFSLYDRGRYVDPLRSALPVLSNKDQKLPKAKVMLALSLLNAEQQKLQLALNSTKQKLRS